MDTVYLALKLTGFGLSGVFLSLILLYVLIRVSGNLFKKKETEKETQDGRGEQ